MSALQAAVTAGDIGKDLLPLLTSEIRV
jgi:hypothetical protein